MDKLELKLRELELELRHVKAKLSEHEDQFHYVWTALFFLSTIAFATVVYVSTL